MSEASCQRDLVIRIALAAMAADPESTLSTTQRQWIIDLAPRTEPLTAHERAKLKGPLLAYITDRMPRCADILRKQFDNQGDA